MIIKENLLGLFFVMVLSMLSLKMFAYDVAVENSDGVTLYYNLINNNTELEVTKGGYNCYYYYSVINIPNEVNYSGKHLKVKSIGQAAFDYCSNLTSITIPNSITTIGASAFAGCGLNTIDIPNSVTTIGRLAFYGCDNLKTVTIPNSVDSLAEATFSNCKELSTVTIEYGVKSIGRECFYFCEKLSSISLPNSLDSIGEYAFFKCTNLSSCIIPNSVKKIGHYAYYGCKYMSSIIIGGGCDYISYSVFGECLYLEDVYCYAQQVPSTHNAVWAWFSVGSATLHVPYSSLQDYKSSSIWSKFANIVPLTDSDPKPTGIYKIEAIEKKRIGLYSIDGKQLITPRRGINIMKMNDGTIRKVVVK